MKAIKLTEKTYWVGAIDWGLRNFHGYTTGRGSTYNAYLILADKVTLIDTVKAPFKKEMMARISSVIDPTKISYIVSNHTEMDHSGSLPDVIREVNPEKVFASKMGVLGLNDHFELDRPITEVKDGESLDLGGMKLTFLETRMLHWPDSMMTYLHEDQILFSQDGFGMHLATEERYDDEIDHEILTYEAKKYFANILTPFSPIVTNTLKKIGNLNLPIALIAPDHGPIWRKDINEILDLYKKWAEQRPTNKAVIVYDTMWQSTTLMANAINEGLSASGVCTKVMPLADCNRSDIATESLNAGALIVGSPTINNQIFPTVADTLVYLKGLKFQNLIGAAFGSYGWSGEATRHITQILKDMKIKVVADELNIKYIPKKPALKLCYDLGQLVGRELGKYI